MHECAEVGARALRECRTEAQSYAIRRLQCGGLSGGSDRLELRDDDATIHLAAGCRVRTHIGKNPLCAGVRGMGASVHALHQALHATQLRLSAPEPCQEIGVAIGDQVVR